MRPWFPGLLRSLGAVLLLTTSLATPAYVVSIDNFFVSRTNPTTGALVFSFNDPFSDGVPPPSAPNFSTGAAASYFVTGSPPLGSESGGKLTLNGSNGVPTFIEGFGLFEGALLQTSTDPASTAGLRLGSAIDVTGIFDLTAPSIAREQYGIRLSDVTAASEGDDEVRMRVILTPGGSVAVQFVDINFLSQSTTTLGSHLLTPSELNNPQIQLELTVDPSGNVSGRYGFGGGFTAFGNTATIFNGETFTRAGFWAATPVPLPGTLWLLGIGLAALAHWRRAFHY
jgi:PEP-CTERM motif-containing protein